MSGTRRPTTRTTRRAVALALAALVAALLPVSTAAAGPPTGSIRFDITDSTPLPATPGSDGLVYVVAGKTFGVDLTFLDRKGQPTILSNSDDTPVSVKYNGGQLGTGSVAAGSSTASVTGLSIPSPVTGAVLTATATTKQGTEITDTSAPFDVLISELPINSGPTSIGGEGGVQGDCNPTSGYPVCGDLFGPSGGFRPGGYLSEGCVKNTNCVTSGTYIQAIAALTSDGSLSTTPATLLMNCDKTLCGGGAIKKQTLKVTLSSNPANEFYGEITAPACVAKGVVTYDPTAAYGPNNAPFCVDYVQSTRDIAGDTILYLLFLVDARVRFP